MSSIPSGLPPVAEQADASSVESKQMEASEPRKAPRTPDHAVFGAASGAAVVFRDYASI
jgi:hypothetical protein